MQNGFRIYLKVPETGRSTNRKAIAKNVSLIQNHRQFTNIVTGDKTLVHFFEPVRQIRNKIWLTKHGRLHVVLKELYEKRREFIACLLRC